MTVEQLDALNDLFQAKVKLFKLSIPDLSESRVKQKAKQLLEIGEDLEREAQKLKGA